jgi:hypothetical protein
VVFSHCPSDLSFLPWLTSILVGHWHWVRIPALGITRVFSILPCHPEFVRTHLTRMSTPECDDTHGNSNGFCGPLSVDCAAKPSLALPSNGAVASSHRGQSRNTSKRSPFYSASKTRLAKETAYP